MMKDLRMERWGKEGKGGILGVFEINSFDMNF